MFRDQVREIVHLFSVCFERPISTSQIEWLYLSPFVMHHRFAAIMTSEDELVGNYSVSLRKIKIASGETFTAGLSATTMTHPRFSGQGVFPRLASLLYDDLTTTGVEIIYGFPNSKSSRTFFARLGWSHLANVPHMRLSLHDRSKPRPQRQSDNRFALSSSVPRTIRLPNWISMFHHVDRSPEYLSWRFVEAPHVKYWFLTGQGTRESGGYAVIKIFRDQVDLVDFLPVDSEEAGAMITFLTQEFQNSKSAVNVWMPRHTPTYNDLISLGFEESSSETAFGAKSLQVGSILDGDFKNWFIQMSDSDVY